MKASILLVFIVLCCLQYTLGRSSVSKFDIDYDAEITEDCLWGRTPAEECCADQIPGQPIWLANPKDCHSMFLCHNQKPWYSPCHENRVWDVIQQECVQSDTPDECPQKTK